MSDFVSSGWSTFVAVATVVGLVACLALLWIASRRKPMAQDNSTGHVWDEDLAELNNPLPLWWMGLFIITIAFSFGYLIFYPGAGSFEGRLGWSSAGQVAKDRAADEAEMAKVYVAYQGKSAPEIAADANAMAIGERLFLNNCAACHGSNARGSKGFPDLTDGDWLYGGTPEKIEETITKGRNGVMPPMVEAIGGAGAARDVAQYVLSLSGSPHNAIAAVGGKSKFTACAACHGPDGKGNQALGAPNLTDQVWLYGYGEDAIVDAINRGHTGTMPAQGGRLTADQIHVLAAYVWGLSNRGLPTAAAAAASGAAPAAK